jgi:membrane protease YdiL (CAAX protease family)
MNPPVSTQPISVREGNQSMERANALVRRGLVFYAVFLGAAMLWRVGFQRESLLVASAADRIHWLRDPLLGLAAGLLVVAASAELTARTRMGKALARALADAIGPLRARDCLVLALSSGIAEEALFRGALQPRVGLVWASLLFALAHLVPRRELLPWSLFSLVAGFLLGGLYAATGNLVAPVVAHVVVNAVNLRRLSRDFVTG